MNRDIFFRAHTVAPRKEPKKKEDQQKWSDYVLIFDTETTLDTSQSLTFGAYRFCQADPNGEYRCREEGLFYPDDINARSLKILRRYVKRERADTIRDCPTELSLYSRSNFVERVLWEAIHAGATVVGFNLPFDLSRLAVDWCKARNGGWSLIVSLRKSRKTGELEANPHRPRIRVTSKDSKSAFISLTRTKNPEEWPTARFLDLHTLASALHSESYSLENACNVFDIPGKLKHEPTGRVSIDEINYCRQDVRASTGLLNAMRKEFDLHPIGLRPDRAYSPASIAKAYLDAMGIVPPRHKFKTPNRVLGIAMQAYYGGRAECRIRQVPVPVVHTDFTSQYPSVNALLGNGEILTAKKLTFDDATAEVRKLLGKVTLDGAFNPRFWKRLKFFALVRPDADIFPVRAVYNGQTPNIGLNHLSSKKAIWFAGPDLIASVLLTGKVPRIEKAIRMIPHGKQAGLRTTKLKGLVTIDPRTDDFFRHVIEQRKRHKSNKSLGHFLKILANAGSYGLFVELTPEKPKKAERIKVFSGQESFSQLSNVLENQGRWYFPPIGALITSGGRLLLAMLERCVAETGGSYLFCDTDSLCIVSSKEGESVPCPGGADQLNDGRNAIKALSWEQVRRIADRFTALNPYDPVAVPGSILKIEDVNFDSSGQQRQLYGYAISAKRYVIYQHTGRNLTIIDPKAHGLGYLYPPKSVTDEDDLGWTFEAWDWLLRHALGLLTKPPTWLNLPAMMRIVLSTPHVLNRLNHATRPFNFLFCPLIDPVVGCPSNADPTRLTLIAPFTKNRKKWLGAACVNVYDGNSYQLSLRQNRRLDKVIPQTFGYILRLYPCHPESKSLAPDGTPCSPDTKGLLPRASIAAGKPRYVGKETDRHWEQGDDLILVTFTAVEYSRQNQMFPADSALLNNMRRHSIRGLIRKTGLSQHTLEVIRQGKQVRSRTLETLKLGIGTRIDKPPNLASLLGVAETQ